MMIDVKKVIHNKIPIMHKLPNFFGDFTSFVLRKIVHQDEINNFINDHKEYKPFDFNSAVINHFSSGYTVSSDNKLNIPETGKVIIVANHPLGAIEALALLDMIKAVRKDIKIVANEMLMHIEPLRPLFLPVDAFEGKTARDSIRAIHAALSNEEAVIIFPTGEVSRLRKNGIKDRAWNKGFLTFARKAEAPILPILISARNSWGFYALSIINKKLSSLLLAHEMFRKDGDSIKMTVGKLIPSSSYFNSKIDDQALAKLFKKHLYNLKKKFARNIFKTIETIAASGPKDEIMEELRTCQLLGETSDGKKIYLYEDSNQLAILNEIGRLREFTFRQVNEGSGKRRDIDKYDKYYKQLILWDDQTNEMVGAYRLGIGKDIYKEYGKDGFYSHTLFKFNEEFESLLEHSIELGRSFVQPRYWGTRALDYLWQGIGAYLRVNPDVKYLWGPVSLSDAYPRDAKEKILYFYSKFFGDNKELVEARNRFVISENVKNSLEKLFPGNDYREEFRLLKENMSLYSLSVPTLYKQYAEVSEDDGTKFLAFNIDPDFNNCIDSLIIVDIDKILESKRKRYIDEATL